MSFDPRESAQHQALTALPGLDAADYLRGRWEGRNPLNVPGPFYGADTDTCCDGPWSAPDNLSVDENALGFVWRQARNDAETRSLLNGCMSDPYRGFAWDGDEHWTVDLVRQWWSERAQHIAYVTASRREWSTHHEESRLLSRVAAAHLAYLSGDTIAADLRRYLFRLREDRYPSTHEALPPI